MPSANITRLALRPVSCPRLDSCGPSRCSNSFRRAAYDAANARCGAPRFHGLATSSPQDGTENARCGSTCGTWAVPTSHGSYDLHLHCLHCCQTIDSTREDFSGYFKISQNLPNNLFRIFKGYPEMFNMSILNQSIHQSIYPSVHNSKVSRFIPLTPIWC